MLGASEAVAPGELFTVADREHRLYAKRETARRPHLFPAGGGSRRNAAAGDSATTVPTSEVWGGVDGRKEVDRILLSMYSPAGVVVDDDLEVLEIRGKASPYLTLPAGKVSFSLMKLIPHTELAEGALKGRPGMKVMFMSGHTQDVVLQEGVRRGTAFLQKPFTPAGLAQKVRDTLDSNTRPAGQP